MCIQKNKTIKKKFSTQFLKNIISNKKVRLFICILIVSIIGIIYTGQNYSNKIKSLYQNISGMYYSYVGNISVEQNGFFINKTCNLDNPDNSPYFDPQIIQLKNGKYRMYVSDRGMNSIICFDSDDLNNWSKKKVCLMPDSDKNSWNSTINRATVTVINNTYVMYYTGQNEGKSFIGIAVSKDGVSFKNYSDKPILSPEYDYEKESVMNPYVIFNKDKQLYIMYYAAGETIEPNLICIATSNDGYNWKKENKIVLKNRNIFTLDCNRIGACEVYYENGKYKMYYIGYTDINTARICYCTSNDGINWKRSFFNVLVSPCEEFNKYACYKPTVMKKDGKEYIFYNGRNDETEQICVAIKQ